MDTHETQPARHTNKIPIGDLDAIFAAITALEPDGSATVSAAQAIKNQLKGAIKTALKRKITYTQLVALLKEKGIELREETLKGYVRATKRPKKLRDSDVEAKTAPQKPEPASIPATSAEPLTAVNPSGSGTPEMMMSAGAPLPQPSAHQTGTV